MSIERQIFDFKPISLSEMNDVSFMKRVDTKFVLNRDQLEDVLENIKSNYRALEIDGKRIMSYCSIYFDTADKKFYFDHHNNIAKRIKIRLREYVDSNRRYLEIKQKDYKGNTNKTRISTKNTSSILNEKELNFVHNVTSLDISLTESLTNSFRRITLVNTDIMERITIDLDLRFNEKMYYPNLAIIEFKQERLNRNSILFQILKKKAIHPYSISKYCIGMGLLSPELKKNNFKPKFLKLNKITA